MIETDDHARDVIHVAAVVEREPPRARGHHELLAARLGGRAVLHNLDPLLARDEFPDAVAR